MSGVVKEIAIISCFCIFFLFPHIQALWNSRSQTIEAILQLQIKASELLDKDAIITRLLVPSSKVGCLLGQGGNVINEMRRRTQADIRVCSKDDKLKFASVDEELVQVTWLYDAFIIGYTLL